MAVASLRILTRISLHIAGVDSVHHSGDLVDLDDAILDLISRGLAELAV
jgi:hypothetical protein